MFIVIVTVREKDKKVKAKVSVYLYSALFVVPHTQGAQAWITQFYLQLHHGLPLPRKRSPDGASTDRRGRYIIAAYYWLHRDLFDYCAL